MKYQEILDFWFEELAPADWFAGTPDLDRVIADRFGIIHQAARQCELYSWRDSARGRLTEVIVLDQFSRNIYRNSAQAFAADSLALGLAQEAIGMGAEQALTSDERVFLYMPYMHSESPMIHELAVQLFGEPGMEQNLAFELKHKAIIDRFGRYPHRNEVLGRESTSAELEFLKTPGSSF